MPPRMSKVQPTVSAPFWQTADGKTVRLWLGHVTDRLRELPARSVQCIITSPPYWNLRDYQTGTWIGGDPTCDHRGPLIRTGAFINENAGTGRTVKGRERYAPVKGGVCACGARRVDQQLGSEPLPDCYTWGKAQCGECFVCNMVAVFREVRRVLRDDGTLWLNLGDAYSATGGHTGQGKTSQRLGYTMIPELNKTTANRTGGLGERNLMGIPWRVALALQADGWVLRQEIIWAKPSPMPESVTNRCTKAHEQVFLLTKGMSYYCDMEAIKESAKDGENVTMANKRSVWTVASQAYEGAHFATFPEKLIRPMILAGTSERGCCPGCAAPWERVVVKNRLRRERRNEYVKRTGVEGTGNSCPNDVAGVESKTLGWKPGCACYGVNIIPSAPVKPGQRLAGAVKETDEQYAARLEREWTPRMEAWEGEWEKVKDVYLELGEGAVPCTVLDPFVGSGTVNVVCIDMGRHSWGIDLNGTYLKQNAVPRIEGVLLSRPGLAWLAGRETKVVVHNGKTIKVRKPVA